VSDVNNVRYFLGIFSFLFFENENFQRISNKFRAVERGGEPVIFTGAQD
jgi:hypothetical protein